MNIHIGIQKAIDLYNHRNANEKPVNRAKIGSLLWPYSSYPSASTCATKLMDGGFDRIRPEWIITLTKELGVDANFIFMLPSKYDQEYEQFLKTSK